MIRAARPFLYDLPSSTLAFLLASIARQVGTGQNCCS